MLMHIIASTYMPACLSACTCTKYIMHNAHVLCVHVYMYKYMYMETCMLHVYVYMYFVDQMNQITKCT